MGFKLFALFERNYSTKHSTKETLNMAEQRSSGA